MISEASALPAGGGIADAKGHDHEVTVDAQSGKVTAAKADDGRNDSDSTSGDHDEV
ncbi:hypothetical protein ABZ915_34445 [Streptomyces sp. NPDC046915]|uniref:hypothetical protein n=1 Tax=Streptomyces sp. NPDC046915 TaxID=3155257 RepID=UPI0033E5E905